MPRSLAFACMGSSVGPRFRQNADLSLLQIQAASQVSGTKGLQQHLCQRCMLKLCTGNCSKPAGGGCVLSCLVMARGRQAGRWAMSHATTRSHGSQRVVCSGASVYLVCLIALLGCWLEAAATCCMLERGTSTHSAMHLVTLSRRP